MMIDVGLALFVIYVVFFLIIFPTAAGIMRDLGIAERETKE